MMTVISFTFFSKKSNTGVVDVNDKIIAGP